MIFSEGRGQDTLMKKTALDLSQFLSKDIVAEIEDIKAYIYKVETIKEKMELYIYISSSKLIFSYLEEKFRRSFKGDFQVFKCR